MFMKTRFGAGLSDNFRELFRRLPGSKAEPRRFVKNAPFTRAQSLSIAAHILVVSLLLIPATWNDAAPTIPKPFSPIGFVALSNYLPRLPAAKKLPTRGGGSGGGRDKRPATSGKPPAFAAIQLVPPRARTVMDARLLAPPTIVGDPRILIPSKMTNWGDPHLREVSDSNGPGERNGIGSRNGNGIGDGNGDGLEKGNENGIGDGTPCGGCEGISMPICAYCPRAQFSDEAVKEKFEGVVFLLVVITPDGRATDIHVSKGLGLGLDEQAVEAVRSWRFKPAVGPDGRPMAVRVPIEVVFHLY